jgi:hypothetical protein
MKSRLFVGNALSFGFDFLTESLEVVLEAKLQLACVAAATADFSTAAANAPPSVEMTFLWVGRERQMQ